MSWEKCILNGGEWLDKKECFDTLFYACNDDDGDDGDGDGDDDDDSEADRIAKEEYLTLALKYFQDAYHAISTIQAKGMILGRVFADFRSHSWIALF